VLNDIAKQKVYHMLGNCYFTHYFNDIFYSPELAFGSETPLYRYNYWGENLGDGYKTLQPMFTAWIESEAHKKNMVKPEYAEIGVYVYPDNYICTKADGTKYNFLHTTAVIFGTEIQ